MDWGWWSYSRNLFWTKSTQRRLRDQYCLQPAIRRRGIVKEQCHYIDPEFKTTMPNFWVIDKGCVENELFWIWAFRFRRWAIVNRATASAIRVRSNEFRVCLRGLFHNAWPRFLWTSEYGYFWWRCWNCFCWSLQLFVGIEYFSVNYLSDLSILARFFCRIWIF